MSGSTPAGGCRAGARCRARRCGRSRRPRRGRRRRRLRRGRPRRRRSPDRPGIAGCRGCARPRFESRPPARSAPRSSGSPSRPAPIASDGAATRTTAGRVSPTRPAANQARLRGCRRAIGSPERLGRRIEISELFVDRGPDRGLKIGLGIAFQAGIGSRPASPRSVKTPEVAGRRLSR